MNLDKSSEAKVKYEIESIKQWLNSYISEKDIIKKLENSKRLLNEENFAEIAIIACRNSKLDVINYLFSLGMKPEIKYFDEYLVFSSACLKNI